MNEVTLEIPEQLMTQLRQQKDSVQTVLLKALEEYLAKQQSDVTKTKTWELCGSLEIPLPESQFINHQSLELSTNYAEHIDEILYKNDLS
jgi:hypothetical protein